MRNIALAALLGLLTACGFTPMYARHTTDVQMSQVSVQPIAEREGQMLRNALLDRGFGGDDGGTYDLSIPALNVSEIDLGIAQDNTATRKQMTMTAHIILTRDGKEILTRTLFSRATYNVLQSQYTTIVSQNSGRRMVVDDLAHQIETQLVLALGQDAKSR